MLKALTGLLLAGAAALAVASPAAAGTVTCTDGPPNEIWGPGYDGYSVYFNINDYCTSDSSLQILSIAWPSTAWYSYDGQNVTLDTVWGPENIEVTVWDGTEWGFDTFYVEVNP